MDTFFSFLTCVKKERNGWDQMLEKGMVSESGSLLRGTWYQGLGDLSPAPVPLLTGTSSKLLSHLRAEPPLQNGDWTRSFLFGAWCSRLSVTRLVCSWSWGWGWSSHQPNHPGCVLESYLEWPRRGTQVSRNCQCILVTSSDKGWTRWRD